MAVDFKELNAEVNKKALELVGYKPADINDPKVKRLQDRISWLMLEAFTQMPHSYNKQGDDVWYFPLIGRWISQDMFVDTLFKLLGLKRVKEKDKWVEKWYYDKSSRASFITAFRNQLRYALRDGDETYGDSSIDAPAFGETDSGSIQLPDDNATKMLDEVLSKMAGLAYVLDVYAAKIEDPTEDGREGLSETMRDRRRSYYRGFFTFDTTKAVKSSDDLGEIACEYNEELFPYMLVALLEYLMTGSFTNMRDVIQNALREGVNLNQRGLLLEKFFRVSHPTLIDYSKLYDRLRKTILGNI